MKLKFLFPIIFYLVISTENTAQPVSFFKEHIQITVEEEYCELVGTYFFISPSKQSVTNTVHYPFPIDKGFSFPDSILVTIPQEDKILSYMKGNKGIFFRLEVQDTTVVQIYYHQPAPNKEMYYILTSTKKWNAPLQESTIDIYIPEYLELESSSYTLNKSKLLDNYRIYHINKKNFMPEKDLRFTWAGSKK